MNKNKKLSLLTLMIIPSFCFGLSLHFVQLHTITYNILLGLMLICCLIASVSCGLLVDRTILKDK